MPKSKRNKQVDLTKTKKHGLEGKKILYQQIQSNVENYAHVFVFSVNDMRNSKMKNVREQWKHSRFCIGKNKIMAKALGLTEEDEFRLNIHKIGQQLKGERGLLFTNQPVEEVINWFRSYSEGDYARSGNIATEDVILPEGPLKQFSHSQESYLRQLGLPTTLQKGVIHLLRDYVVCQVGDRLSPESARILKLLGYEMAEFRIRIQSVWSQDGNFVDLGSETKENLEDNQGPFMKDSFELAKYVADLGTDAKMEVTENVLSEVLSKTPNKSEALEEEIKEPKQKVSEKKICKMSPEEKSDNSVVTSTGKKDTKSVEEEIANDAETIDEIEAVEEALEEEVKEPKQKVSEKKICKMSPKEKSDNSVVTSTDKKDIKSVEEEIANDAETIDEIEAMEVEDTEEPATKRSKSQSVQKKPTSKVKASNKKSTKGTGKKCEEVAEKAVILELTSQKIEASEEKPKKFSPKLTRARAAAANIKVKTPDSNDVEKSARKRKLH